MFRKIHPADNLKGNFLFLSVKEKKLPFRGSLGIITKLQALDKSSSNNDDFDFALVRTQRFVLQDIACKILSQKEVRVTPSHPDGHYTYVHRVNHCLKRRIDKNKAVGIRYNEARQKAHYDNLQRCGSVWTCPVCANQITEVRRCEVKQAIDKWIAEGGSVYMGTYTNRHHRGDDLGQLVQGQKEAFKELYQSHAVKDMLKLLGCEVRITAVETPYSDDNGWHPHYHTLFFFKHEISNNGQAFQTFMGQQWIKACAKVGLKSPSMEHGFVLHDGTYASKYITKWGLEHEITKGHIKKGRKNSLSPFDLLRQSVEQPYYKKLFKQYADVFKGSHQLYWTKGGKKKLGIEEKSDTEIANETEKESILLKELPFEIYQLITLYSMRGEYLQAFEKDYLDMGTRAYDLVMKLAQFEADKIIERANTS